MPSSAPAPLSSLPYWWQAAPPEDPVATALPREVDVLVVGAGYTGLSAALTLARHGRSVLVLDAEQPGIGASSRNGGMLGPSFQKMDIDGMVAQHGEAHTMSVLQESMDALAYTMALIDEHRIDCDLQRVGRFRAAVIPAHLESMKRDADRLQRFIDLRAEFVERADQHHEIGSDIYHGGVIYHRDAGLHPAKYARGLLALAQAAGARVQGHCAVQRIERDGSGWRIRTARGELRAGQVMLATNGYTGPEFGWARRRLVPVQAAIIVTEALAPGVIERLMPKRRMHGETRRMMNFYRPTPDGTRILLGGRPPVWGGASDADTSRHLHGKLCRVFPELASTRIEHLWRGKVAFTFDLVPHMGQHQGIFYALGYCGSGVGRSTYFGHKTALKMLGRAEGKTFFDDLPFRGFPGYTGNPWPLPAILSWYGLQDWRDLRR